MTEGSPPISPPPIYTTAQWAEIKASLARRITGDIEPEHRARIDWAARHYQMHKSSADSKAAKQTRAHLERIRDACMNLLHLVQITELEAAEDGPYLRGTPESQRIDGAIEALHLVRDPDTLRQRTTAIADFARATEEARNLLIAPSGEEIEAAERIGDDGERNADPHLRLALRGTLRGHGPQFARDDWILELADVYEAITGRPADIYTSVRSETRTAKRATERGCSGGTFFDFLQACAASLGLTLRADQVDGVVRSRRKRPHSIPR